ncbi:MAG: short chain dehydrogenase [Bacteroidia bacterium]|nr:short chain dehydrogenase [Bacteroidia bacterium]
MKIVLIGGSGTIGSHVYRAFSKDHEVILANRRSPDFPVDIAKKESIEALFKKTGQVDAVICIAGEAKWADFDDLNESDFYIGIKSKMMGQVNLVKIAKEFLNPSGSITLTTGILGERPVPKTTSAALVNGAIHSFVLAFKQDYPEGPRVNVVAPGLVEDSYEKYKDYFPGHIPVPMVKVVEGYKRSVLSSARGELIRIYEP